MALGNRDICQPFATTQESQAKLDEIQEAGEDASESLKSEAEQAWKDLKTT
jgi:hypothetical protein